MKIRLVSLFALIMLFLAGFAYGDQEAGTEASLLREGHPEQYLVKKGDTLWGIASKFLIEPWHWPEIWYVNPDISNPHLIYPGDKIFLKYVGGDPQISLKRGPGERTYKLKPQQRVRKGDRYEKMEPAVRVSPLESAIPAIPLDAVASFMTTGRIVEHDTLALAPRILAGKHDTLVFGPGDRFYATGVWDEDTSIYGIFREGDVYVDPKTGETLGHEAIEVGLAKAVAREGDIVTFEMKSVQGDVRIGDRLMATEERRLESTFYPTSPDQQVEGVIMAVLGGVTQVGRNDVVVVNRGLNSGVEAGTVLEIAKKGALVRDHFAGGYVQLPTERAGLLMIFRSFEKMAYGLVLQTTESLRVGDFIRNP
jgi:hypothetical protein